LSILVLDFAVKVNDAAADSYAGLQFSGMEGLCLVVIGSGGETFNHFLFVGVAGKEDDIGVELFMFPTDTLAQLNAR
jgi:hypothetical protein